ncbi:MAG TPA: hypothetical protein DCY13_17735 [Verrucomicrobiales bacterium]|nr:hypothetical protein [Verrucomicrobiales bacterium]
MFRIVVPAPTLLACLLSCLRVADAATVLPVVVFAEDFNGSRLRSAVVEYDPNPGVPDWATPAESLRGWSRGADNVAGGTTEWLGWSFTTTAFWIGDDDQSRSLVFPFSTTEVIAVADSDEAADRGTQPNDGYNAYLRTPLIDVSGFHFPSLALTFRSNFRREEDERSFVRFHYDGGPALSVEIHDQGTTLTPVTIRPAYVPGAPAAASTLLIEFAHEKADNNWWWAIDNIRITGLPQETPPDNAAPVVVTDAAGPVTAEVGDRLGYAFSATDPETHRVQLTVDWGDGSTADTSLLPSGHSHGFDHTWNAPGTFTIQVRATDEFGLQSGLVTLQTVTVTGPPIALLTPPYLQNVSTNGIVIMCESREDLPLVLEYGTHASMDLAASMTRVASGGGSWFHRAHLQGLEPGHSYEYRVRLAGGEHLSDIATFHTAPLGEPDFKFSVWSDSQGHNRGAWTAAPLEPTISMMKHMVTMGVDFGLTAGDLAENGASYSDTRQYYLDRVARHLGTSVPWFVAWGNHDNGSPTAPLRLASDMPSRFRPGLSPGHGSYSFTYANCFFVCIDHFYQDEITNGWLESQLASPAAQQARFRFLAIHVPPYCERWIDGSAALRQNLVPLLERYRVDACFSGHTHEYERGELNHVHYVITGGGSWLDHPEVVVKNWEHMVVGGAHDVPGSWRAQSSPGVLGPPQPIVGGLFNEYALVTIRDSYLRLEAHGFNADGSVIGVLDTMEIGIDPGPDTDGDRLRDAWELANGLNPNDATGINGADGDLDGDGLSNLGELIAGTKANDAVSVFAISDLQRTEAGVTVTWSSQPGKEYRIDTMTDWLQWQPVMNGGEPLVVPAAAGSPTTMHVLPDLGLQQGYVRVRIR